MTGSLSADADKMFDASDTLLGVEGVDDVDVVTNKNLEASAMVSSCGSQPNFSIVGPGLKSKLI